MDDIKVTTIRDKAWPTNTPIMLYSWTGKPYRSKHLDLTPIIVESIHPIIFHLSTDGTLSYIHATEPCPWLDRLWYHEGFKSEQELIDWFTPILPKENPVTKYLMKFHRIKS